MAIFPVRFLDDPVIKEKSLRVTRIGKDMTTLTKDMADTMYDAQGVGLAAPQIGILKRVIVIDMHDDRGLVAYVNPRILELSGHEEVDDEGCLCVPDVRVPVKRATRIVVEALDLKGRTIKIEAEDMMARVLQHEIDHLEGTTILERTGKEDRRRAIREFLESQGGS